jgi:uncharacterized protein (DUF427 family)
MADQRGRVRIEKSDRRVRALLGGQFVVDTIEPRLVWEKPYYPTYYVPLADLRSEALEPSGETRHSPSRGTGDLYHVRVGDTVAKGAALRFADSPIEELRELVRLDWHAMDAWYEEDEEVHVHPRDPFTRIDILPSSRHIQVEVDGVIVADSHRPLLLFETGLPTRYYLPQTDVRLDLLTPSAHTTQCPYKGTAEYWHLESGEHPHENAVWTYRSPVHESARIAGYVSFYNEHVDLIVDGRRLDRPRSVFS